MDSQGHRIQIKSRRLSPTNKSRQLGDMPPDNELRFDVLAGVVFAADFVVENAALIPTTVLVGLRSGEAKRPRFHLREAVLRMDGVVDVTRKLRNAQR